MDRRLTNLIRFVMDECLPPVLRDNKYFMYPFFWLAYRGKNISQTMAFKSLVQDFTDAEYQEFYARLDSISRNRLTDLNTACLDSILGMLDSSVTSLLDAGCGAGYLLRRIKAVYPAIALAGSDIIAPDTDMPCRYYQSDLLALQTEEPGFDVVTCCHTLEHIRDLRAAVCKLRKLCRKFLIIVVPCQRYYYYTLDEHLHFFTHEHQLHSLMGLEQRAIISCRNLGGDWLLVVRGSDG